MTFENRTEALAGREGLNAAQLKIKTVWMKFGWCRKQDSNL